MSDLLLKNGLKLDPKILKKVERLFADTSMPALQPSVPSTVSSRAIDESLLSREIDAYRDRTGFPSLVETSEKIEEHAIEIILEAASQSGIEIKFVGYDKSCSVGHRKALPGSDLDCLSMVVAGTDEQRKSFIQQVQKAIDPTILDPDSFYPGRVILLSDMLSEEADEKGMKAIMCDLIQHDWGLINAFSEEEGSSIKELPLSQQINFVNDMTEHSLKYKLSIRDKIESSFPELTIPERHLLMRIVKSFSDTEEIDLSAEPSNPLNADLLLLAGRGLLTYNERDNYFTATFATHKKVKDGGIIDLNFKKLKL